VAGPLDLGGPSSGQPPVPTDLLVRAATPADVGDLAALAALTFPLACPPDCPPRDQQAFVAAHLTAARFSGYVADPARRVLLALPAGGGPPVGYTMLVLGDPADDEVRAALTLAPTVEVSKCYVHPDQHGSGVATALMDASLAVARAAGAAGAWLGVNQLNARARRFYERSGFAVVGTKHFRVGDRVEDDFVLERAL